AAAADDEELEDEVDEAADALQLVEEHRYLRRDRPPEEQRMRNAYARCEEHLSWNEDDFKRAFRVTQTQLRAIAALLEKDDVFQKKARGRPQQPIIHQLLLVLWRLAHSGTGATVFHIAERFGVSGEK
ncbi:hypothetical protein CF319_g9172, partial [Tilletia indica]